MLTKTGGFRLAGEPPGGVKAGRRRAAKMYDEIKTLRFLNESSVGST